MPHIPKVVCHECGREMRVVMNDFVLQANAANGPYYKVAGDLYECGDCAHRVVTGFAFEPLTEYYKPDFDAVRHDGDFSFIKP